MSGNSNTRTKNVYFMRHGRASINSDYERLNYNEFMACMLKKEDPALCQENDEIKVIPAKIDVIYPSLCRRARDSAKRIQNYLAIKPEIDYRLGELVDEVKFSSSIITEEEFCRLDGLKGCRKLILERWCEGKHGESFEESIERVEKLRQAMTASEYNNMLVITHGWYLRLIHFYYVDKEKTLQNLLSAPLLKYGEILKESLEFPERFCQGINMDVSKDQDWNKNGNSKLMILSSSEVVGVN